MRLNESSLHSWDARVAVDPGAGLDEESAALLAQHFSGELGFLLGFVGKADQLSQQAVVALDGYVTQDDNLLPWRTTIDNVLFPIEVQGRLNDARARPRRVLVRAVGLAGFERYYPHELSGGMRKRAALIRTLAYDPPVILMDEPFAAVDAQTRTQLQADLLTLWGLGRKTIIFVTHDITEAIALGDRALVLSRQPTRIAAEHAIPIPRPRNVQDIFALEGFAAVYQRIRSEIQ